MPDDNALASYQAVPALLMRSLPVRSSTVSGASELLTSSASTAPAATAVPAAPAAASAPAAPAPTAVPSMPATAAAPGLPWLELTIGVAVLLAIGFTLRLFAVRSN